MISSFRLERFEFWERNDLSANKRTHTHTWYLDMKYLCHAKIWMRGQVSLKTAFVAELCSRFTRSPNTLSFLCKRGFADPMGAIRSDKEGQLMNFSVCVCVTHHVPSCLYWSPAFVDLCPGAEWQQALCILVAGYERLEVCGRLVNGEFVLIHCFESSWNWEIRWYNTPSLLYQ